MSNFRDSWIRSAELISERIVPNLRNSQFRYREVLESHIQKGSRWLDVGCGHNIIPGWIPASGEWQSGITQRASLFVGIDGDLLSLYQHRVLVNKVFGRITPLPFKNSSFTIVTLNMVAEHLSDPLQAFQEIFRVLTDPGIAIIHTPNRYSYRSIGASAVPQRLKVKMIKFFEDREERDVYPTFYRFNSGARITTIAEKIGFNVLELRYEETTPVASVLGPIVIPELLFLRLLRFHALRKLRGDLIIILQKRVSPRDR